MRRFAFAAVFCLAGVTYAGEAERVFDRVKSSVVTISIRDESDQIVGEGSGVVVETAKVVTNCHVVEGAVAIKIKSAERDWSGSLFLVDRQRDLCLIDVMGFTAPAVKIRVSDDLKIGEPAYAVGNPLSFGLAVSAGLVTARAQPPRPAEIYTTAALSPGSSGGGLFDSDGRLIGITTRVLSVGQNFNVAVPAEWIGELRKRGVAPIAKKVEPGPDPKWSDEAELLRAATKWQELADWCKRWLEVYPSSGNAQELLGLALMNLNQLKPAQAALLMAVQINPRSAFAHAYLSMVQYRLPDRKAASASLARAIEIQPRIGYFHNLRAEWLEAEHDLEGALVAAQKAVQLDPGDTRHWHMLGMLRHQKNQFQEAVQAYRTALKLNPNNAGSTSSLAAALTALGNTTAAREALTSSTVNKAYDANTWITLGENEKAQGHLMEAEKAFRKAMALDPTRADARFHLSGVLYKTSRMTEAEVMVREAVKIKPDYASAWAILGAFLQQQNKKEEAKQAFFRGVESDPTLADGWRGLAGLQREQRDWAGAAAAWGKLVQLPGTISSDWALLGEARMKLQQMDSAFDALKHAEQLDPNDPIALQTFVGYYSARGDMAQSLQYADRALAVDSADPRMWSNKGYCLLKLQRYPEAIESFQSALKLDPEFTNAWINLGEAYLRQKQLGKSIQALEEALKRAPQTFDARLYLAQALLGSNQFTKAKAHLDLLANGAPSHPVVLYMTSAMYVAQGEREKARPFYRKLKEINPTLAGELRRKSPAGVLDD